MVLLTGLSSRTEATPIPASTHLAANLVDQPETVFDKPILQSHAVQDNKRLGVRADSLVQPSSSSPNLEFDGQFFFSYDHTTMNDASGGGRTSENEFTLKRGYITFRRAISNRFSIRFTQDISIDEEGDGAGDIELRLKYALLRVSMKDAWLLRAPVLEVGVVHRPWIDFEQDINDYRSQKQMFLDQNRVLSSADYGFSFSAMLGEPLEQAGRKGLRTSPGRYGSVDVGLYNGGGYSALEQNNNKLLEARLTLRPLFRHLPGFQISALSALGKGNNSMSSAFQLAGGALSYESARWSVLGQVFRSKGDGSGIYINQEGDAYKLSGWSVFSEYRPLDTFPLSMTGRWEELRNEDLNHLMTRQSLLGISYVFQNRSKFMISVADVKGLQLYGFRDFTQLQFVSEIRF